MKTCACCHKEKPLDAFGRSARYKSGINNRCKACCSAASARSEAKHGPYKVDREKSLEAQARFRQRHPDKAAEYQRRYYEKHKEEIRAKARASEASKANNKRKYEANKEAIIARSAAWQRANKARVNAKNAAWRAKNIEKVTASYKERLARTVEERRARGAAWKKANPDKANASTQRRRARKAGATPAWRNEFFIREAYHLAKLRTEATGIKWHVDHIVPLRSPVVCGLHVEQNLQIIPAVVNQVKSNLRWPDMPTSRESAHG